MPKGVASSQRATFCATPRYIPHYLLTPPPEVETPGIDRESTPSIVRLETSCVLLAFCREKNNPESLACLLTTPGVLTDIFSGMVDAVLPVPFFQPD